MRIAVVGVGGVGGYFGGRLAQAGIETIFVARGATLDSLRKQGLRVDSIRGDFVLPRVHVTDDPAIVGNVDVILFAVKSWQVAEAAATVKAMIGRDTIAVPLENGLEAPEELAAQLGREHVLGGLCGIVSYVVEPGHIRHIGADPLVMFGELDHRRSDRAERLRAAFESAGVTAEIPPDIHRSMWTKFLFIAPMSGIGAATRASIGLWRTMPETRNLAVAAIREILSVAHARGVTLATDALELTLHRYDGLPAESTSSLQRDLMEGRPSELEAQLGAVVRMARENGISVPVCETLYCLLLPQERRSRESN